MSEEIRVTDPVTGASKGKKLEEFALIPVEPLEELARVYGFGCKKYASHNWAKGYSWSLSFSAMMRHAWLFWRGQECDEESGLSHMAHVAWHCMTMMWFAKYRRNHDDRMHKVVQMQSPVLTPIPPDAGRSDAN